MDNVRHLRAKAQAAEPEEAPTDFGEDGFEPDDEGRGEEPPEDAQWLPDQFPVVPLGLNGRTCYFLDECGQLQPLLWEKLGRANIEGLMGRKPLLLETHWPRLTQVKGKDGPEWIVTGWRPEDAGRALKAACAEKGIWRPEDRLRGAGSWLGDDGELIIHYGDLVAFYPTGGGAIELREPGEIGRYVYSASPALRQPATQREDRLGIGATLMAELKSWNWSRPEVDPYLCLGHMVAGVLGGALDWRPLGWVTGGKGSGKSHLHKWRKGLLDNWIVSSSDATGAGIWQKLGYDSRPVDIDEAEGEEDNRRVNGLLSLARQAASGGIVLRGGADHTGREFTSRSSFLFSSIGIPPLNSADRSRIAIMQLKKLPPGVKAPDVSRKRMAEMGRRLLRRIVDQWPRFRETFDRYARALEAGGHSGRGVDVFGTLLACQDLVLFDVPPESDTLAHWQDHLAVGGLAELAGDMSIDRECLLHLMTKPVEAYRGGVQKLVSAWVAQAAQRELMGVVTDEAKAAKDILALIGLDVKPAPKDKATGEPKWPGLFLWVAYRHMGLAKLFERSKWQGSAETVGGWVQHLGWLDGAQANISFWCGTANKAVLVPIDHCLPTASGSSPHNHSAAGRAHSAVAGDGQEDGARGRQAAEAASLTPPPPQL
jgi:hypothetical protein